MDAGSVLGHYRIAGPLGKGGMGEVYTAEDTRLKRQVALKLLPPDLAADPERLGRFRREAEALAALNHPGIVTIYSIEEAEGRQFLTMELVEGEPLGARLGPDGLPVAIAIDWAVQICDAMVSAHARGIIHRDLKPANIVVTPENRLKVLDFGLSKRVHEASPSAATQLAADPLTEQGSFVGTVAYMSPEQAQGKPVDERSDIFSFGVILYEMLAGVRPFTGDSQLAILSAILREMPPPIRQRRVEVPERLAGPVVNRCLAKRPSDRYGSFRELRDELAAIGRDLASAGISPAGHRRYRRVAVAFLLLVLAAAAAGLLKWRERQGVPRALPTLDQMALLTTHGAAGVAAISSDGKYVAYVRDPLGRPSLWIRQATAANDLQIVAPLDVRYKGITFSPDGSFVYYTIYDRAGEWGSLHRVRALGGHAEKVVHDIDTGISFNRDGSRFAFIRFVLSKDTQTSQLMTAQPDGGDQRIVASLKGNEQLESCTPVWTPDDSRLLAAFYAVRGFQLGTIDAVTGERHLIPQPWSSINALAWSGGSIVLSGRPLQASGRGWSGRGPTRLWSVDPETGDQLPLTRDVNTYHGVSAAGDRQTVVTVRTEPEAQIWVADKAGSRQITSGDFLDGITGVSWLDEERIVFTSNRAEFGEVWTTKPDGTALEKLGLGTNVRWPTPTPDGKYLFFHKGGSLWRSSPDGANGQEIATRVSPSDPLVAARSGDSVYYYGFRTGANGEALDGIYRSPVLGGTPTLVHSGRFEVYDVLTDGRMLGATLVPQIKGGPGEVRVAAVFLEPAQGEVEVLEGIPLIKPPLAGDRLSIPMQIGPGENEILYVDVAGETANVWQHSLLDGRRQQLTNFTAGTILWFARSPGGRLAISHGRVKHDVVRVGLGGEK